MQSHSPGIVEWFSFSLGIFFCRIFAVAHLGHRSIGLDNRYPRYLAVRWTEETPGCPSIACKASYCTLLPSGRVRDATSLLDVGTSRIPSRYPLPAWIIWSNVIFLLPHTAVRLFLLPLRSYPLFSNLVRLNRLQPAPSATRTSFSTTFFTVPSVWCASHS